MAPRSRMSQYAPEAAGTFAIVVGCLVLAGWALGLDLLQRLLPPTDAMEANAAVALILLGTSLVLLRTEGASGTRRRAGQACALVAAGIGAVTFFEYALEVDLGIDQALFHDWRPLAAVEAPGRMPPTLALDLVVLGAALALLDAKSRTTRSIGQFAALATASVSLLTLLGLVYGAPGAPEATVHFTATELHAAVTMLVLSVGVLWARPDRGFMRLVSGQTRAGVMLRHLLPAGILLLSVLGWLRQAGEQAGLYRTEGGTSLFVVASIIVFSALIWESASYLQRDDVALRLAQTGVRRRDAILRAVGFSAARFLEAPSWQACMNEVLEQLGTAAGVSRAYVFENHTGDEGELLLSERFEWTAPGIAPTIGDPANVNFPYSAGYERWEELLGGGSVIHGHRRDFPAAERADMVSEDILSLAIVPIFAGDRWWGFMGFDDCLAEREWFAAEIEELRTAAGALGAAIERQRIDELLLEAETRYRLLVERLPAVTYTEVPDESSQYGYRETYVSPQVEDVFGFSAEEWMTSGGAWGRVIHPDDRERVFELTDRATQTGEPYRVEYRITPRPGETRWVRDEAVLFRDEDGRPTQWQGIVFDITELKQAELATLARETAERANRAKSEFLSRMSHELRTPLNSVLGFAQLLSLEDLTTQQSERVEHILRGGRHLLGIVNEVLDISRIDIDRLGLSPEPVVVEPVFREALELVQFLADDRGIVVEHPQVRPGACVLADRQRLKQILVNLLANAIKYNRDGGAVRPAVEDEGQARMRISIRDTGPGIPADQIALAFEPFERLDAERTGIEGTGLGLPLSKRLAEAMGGEIGVESVVGEGSTFWVDLPVAEIPPLPEDQWRGLPSPKSARSCTVLCIEDNPANLELVEHVLGGRPETTLLSAMQGQLGVELAGEHRPDIILLDVHLPDIPGDEVLRRLRADSRTADVPVVVISADATDGQRSRMIAGGASAYLEKPLDIARLLEVIEEHLPVDP